MEEKLRLFPALDHIVKPGALLLTNTSSLNVTQMGAVTKRPDKVCGLHFFNPAPVMRLVEVVQTITSSEDTIETVKQFALSLGKTPVLAKDTAGFIVNFLLIPYLIAAIRMLENGMASRDDIDTAMKLGCGYPMGPFTLLDYVGLDTTLWAAEAIGVVCRTPDGDAHAGANQRPQPDASSRWRARRPASSTCHVLPGDALSRRRPWGVLPGPSGAARSVDLQLQIDPSVILGE